ncbi:unnamed protein product [Schistosoma margrebowiei]|uniref:Nibrin n=1 Tax=Schistosoma margrebowiei TaxID=48269 RepID=A0AA84ZJ12_9TREM|nr:unnamed protein product [Schistosoma margrebowiei]
MWELQEFVGDVLNKAFVISQPGVIKFGGSGCDVDLRPVVCSEVAKMFVIGNDANCVNGLQFNLSENVQGQSLVNGVSSKEYQLIKSGDIVQFRSVSNKKFILIHKELNILFSSMERNVRKKAKTVANLIHANVLSDWSNECNILVMQSLIVTSKVIFALLSCIPIVTPDYLEEIKKIQSYTFATKPDPKDFLPIIKEEKLAQNDASKFLPNDLRRLLFSGKVFFVLNKDKYNILSEIIRLGNGSSCLLDSPDALLTSNSNNKVHVTGHIAVDDLLRDILSKPESCVVHFHPTSVTESWQRKVYSVLRSLRRRPILESELGFAVVYCSTKLYCNPDKRCPDGLYQEIDISGTFSVNPFQIESEVVSSEFSQLSTTVVGAKIPDFTHKNFSSKVKNTESDSGLKLRSYQTARLCERKFGSTISKIVPVKTPERITVGNVLVHDSEPLVSQNFVDSPQTAHLDLENQEPCKLETILKNSISTSTFEPSLIHQPLACTDKNDLLNTLNNMHSLLQTKIKQGILLESNVNNKKNATLLFPSLSNKSFDSIKPEIPKYESLLENDANSSVVTRSNSCNLDLNNGHSFPSNNENRRSGSWLRKHPIDNGADIVDTLSQTNLVIIAPITIPQEVPHLHTEKRLNKVNFKNFIKIWPSYLPRNPSIKPCVPSSCLSKPIPLASYQQTPEKCDSRKSLVKSKQPLDNEQERINKLFEESCKAPSLKKFGKLTTF